MTKREQDEKLQKLGEMFEEFLDENDAAWGLCAELQEHCELFLMAHAKRPFDTPEPIVRRRRGLFGFGGYTEELLLNDEDKSWLKKLNIKS